MRDYHDYLLWDVIYQNNLPRAQGARILEVGSAPGDHLLKFRKAFGYEPYGIEYSERGVELNRKLFASNGLDPANVIHGDFFSAEFQETYRGKFDIAVSRGFIEHFDDVETVIDSHLAVLRDGGYLVVTIPNLRGVNYVLAWFFNREVLRLHNLAVMSKEEFCSLFSEERLSRIKCDYFGIFSFSIFNTTSDSWKRYPLFACAKLQRVMNVLFRAFFGQRGIESRFFSPYLIFMGIKKT